MSTSKYIRSMSFGELMRSTFSLYLKSFWPVWFILILINLLFDPIIQRFILAIGLDNLQTLLLVPIFLPALFIGPAMLIISNIVLERPKKSLTSFLKGMSLGMILKIFLLFSPILIIILVSRILGLLGPYFEKLYLLFSIPLLVLTPLWVFYPMSLLLEKKSVLEAMRRTKTFTGGQVKRLLQIQLLTILLSALFWPLGIARYFLMWLPDTPVAEWFGFGLFGIVDVIGIGGVVNAIVNRIANGLVLVLPITLGFVITMYILHYYQVRAEKENFSEELLAQELGYQPMEEMMNV